MSRLRGLDEYPRRRRKSQDGISVIIRSILDNQACAIGFGLLGIVFASSIPFHILEMIPKARIQENMFAAPILNGLVGAMIGFTPWLKIFGYFLLVMSSASLFIKGRSPSFRRTVANLSQNNIIAGVYFISIFILIGTYPPYLMGKDENDAIKRRTSVSMAEVQQAMAGNGISSAPHKSIETSISSEVSEVFPDNGTVVWGREGQPIGGKFGTLQIWDVTQSPQDKVLRIRSIAVMGIPNHLNHFYAEVYVKSGQKVELSLPIMRVYQVTAISGDKWINKDMKFSDPATVVDFGMITLPIEGSNEIIAMGAPDQTANVVTRDKF